MGAPWHDLPNRHHTKRAIAGSRNGLRKVCLKKCCECWLSKDVKERGGLDLRECLIDGSFVIAKKGATGWENPIAAASDLDIRALL
jgi:hypothetical protein